MIVILSLFILYRFERSLGLTWMAVKRSGILSESIGIGVFNHKLIAFVIGCFFSGIAGALFAHYMGIIETGETGKFGALASIYTIIYLVVGGEATFVGPILGAGILTIMPELFRPLKEYQPMFVITETSEKTIFDWNTRAIPPLARRWGAKFVVSSPLKMILPFVGRRLPSIISADRKNAQRG
jgi:ABC-type branched-subunit amino acid transport system permease subunit